jgi:exopolysaccharide/PEP-CTERM locus tyrosine autokinase
LDKLRRGTSEAGSVAAAPATARREPIGALRSGTEAEAERGPRIVVDRSALRAAGYLPEESQDRQFADEYRQIKRPLLANAFSPDASTRHPSPRLIMMASALPGDGKTFTSINLALSLARERDSSVVLVDADVAKPHVSRIFGVENEPGLLDALADPAIELAPLILPTDVRGLAILPAGRVREGATELLSSGRMGDLHAQILARNPQRLALFDSPPLVVSSESRALAATMGQIVVVVRSGHTPRQAVLEALEELPAGRQVGLVLNQGRRHLLDGYYGHSYGSYGDSSNA